MLSWIFDTLVHSSATPTIEVGGKVVGAKDNQSKLGKDYILILNCATMNEVLTAKAV